MGYRLVLDENVEHGSVTDSKTTITTSNTSISFQTWESGATIPRSRGILSKPTG